MPLFALYEGWVITLFWTWFIRELGVPDIDIWQAAGISLLINMMAYQIVPDERDGDEIAVDAIVRIPLLITAVLVFGYFYHILR